MSLIAVNMINLFIYSDDVSEFYRYIEYML